MADAAWISLSPLLIVSASDSDTGVCWDFHDVRDFCDVDVDLDCSGHDELLLLDLLSALKLL